MQKRCNTFYLLQLRETVAKILIFAIPSIVNEGKVKSIKNNVNF